MQCNVRPDGILLTEKLERKRSLFAWPNVVMLLIFHHAMQSECITTSLSASLTHERAIILTTNFQIYSY